MTSFSCKEVVYQVAALHHVSNTSYGPRVILTPPQSSDAPKSPVRIGLKYTVQVHISIPTPLLLTYVSFTTVLFVFVFLKIYGQNVHSNMKIVNTDMCFAYNSVVIETPSDAFV